MSNVFKEIDIYATVLEIDLNVFIYSHNFAKDTYIPIYVSRSGLCVYHVTADLFNWAL